MILQLISVKFSEYHARYSPFTRLFFTVTLCECQNASFVSKLQSSNTASLIYWKEYLPLKSTFVKCRFSLRIIKYSDCAAQFFMFIFFTDQPNSGETISQFSILTLLHSRSALMPCSFVERISMPFEYQSAARQSSVISQESIFRFSSCQKG